MKNRILQYLFLSGLVMLVFSACRKDPAYNYNGKDPKETKQNGKTFVWITEADGNYTQFFDVFSDTKTITLFTVRRDAANTADLNKAITVTLVLDADSTGKAGLTTFTSDLATEPSAADLASGGLYTAYRGVTKTSTGYTIKFAPGEFAKSIILKVDGSKLDLSNTYGGVYKITDFGGFIGKVGYSEILAGVAVKNAYDGVYSYDGNLVRLPADGSIDTSPLGGTIKSGNSISLVTSGPNSNTIPKIYWADLSTTVGGIDFLQIAVDPATNKVTVTSSGNKYLANIPGQENDYDPDSQTFHLNFAWTSGGPGTNGRQAHLTLVRTGSR